MDTKLITISVLVAVVVSAVTATIVSRNGFISSDDAHIKAFYAAEVAVHVSPHGLRKHMDKGDDTFILVDLRSQEEYEREHIIGAINIPAYKDPYTSAYGDVERIVNSFSELDQEKDIIVYCYSIPCMTGRKIGNMLAEHGIYVQLLSVGWNEWRYHWTLWNHEHEWDETDVSDYVISGSEPGVPQMRDGSSCTIENELGC
ncbi:MAG: rhodanese-like domain-containing protein [Candidatus Pacebacteria bacterium]|nr:rhodanese-like domain-containing protein [Candidatus Paceibacterota bacterium]